MLLDLTSRSTVCLPCFPNAPKTFANQNRVKGGTGALLCCDPMHENDLGFAESLDAWA